MPGYHNPKFAYVEPRGSGLGVIIGVAVLAVECYASYEVAQWLASIAVIIVAVVAVITTASVTTLGVVLLHRHRGLQHLDAPQWATERLGASHIPSHGAVPVRPAPSITARSQPAIAPVVHYRLHLHAAPTPMPTVPVRCPDRPQALNARHPDGTIAP